MSYFDIVNTDLIKDTILKKLGSNKTIDVKIQANFGVDTDNFDFFLSRRQFED